MSRFSVCDLSRYLLISFAAEGFCFAEIQLLDVYRLSESIGTGVAALDFMKNRGLRSTDPFWNNFNLFIEQHYD